MASWNCCMIILLAFYASRIATSTGDNAFLRRFYGSGRPLYGGDAVDDGRDQPRYGGVTIHDTNLGYHGHGRGQPLYGGSRANDAEFDFPGHGRGWPLYGGAAIDETKFDYPGRSWPFYGGAAVDGTEFDYRNHRHPFYGGAATDPTESHTRGTIFDAEPNRHPRGRRGHPGRHGTVDVRDFGAIGDGKRDDTKAFLSAWNAVCAKESNDTKMTIPCGKVFLISEVEFKGPCNNPVTVELLGTLVAPVRSEWKDKDADEWIKFHGVDGLTVIGNGQGLIDGQGEEWWDNADENDRPTALRFSRCNNLQLTALKHINSARNHISLTNSSNVMVSDLHITAPEKSPNTDAFDISHSRNITITDCIVATGDDCVAINNGTSNVMITRMLCGPGHGISIGSLGKNGGHDEVEGITVKNCTLNQTTNGVRIKTWQGGSGFARNIIFSDINFIAAANPIIIDQFYCPHKTCRIQESAVEVSDVTYFGLRGTWAGGNATIDFACSKTVPCTGITVDDVDIVSADPDEKPFSLCKNVHGKVIHSPSPYIACLRNDDYA